MFNDESDNDGSGSVSPCTCVFLFCSGEYFGSVGDSVGHGCDVGSGISPPKIIESIGDVVTLVVFVLKGADSKVGRLIEIFCFSKS